ncbi:MAG: shikimate kinase [Enterococcus sp.]
MTGIFLIGFMGVGKSTVGKALAHATQRPFVDLDAQIVARIGMPIAHFFAEKGEAAFRQIENELLVAAVDSKAVISTGGGIVLAEANRKVLQRHPHVVYLTAEPATLLERIRNDQDNVRPLAQDKTDAEVVATHTFRQPFYQQSASLRIDTTNKTIAQIVTEIMEGLEKA